MPASINVGRLFTVFIAAAVVAWLTVPGGVLIALAVGGGLTAAIVAIDLWGAYQPDRYLDQILGRFPTWVRVPVGFVVISVFNYFVDGRHAGRAIGNAAGLLAILLAFSWWDRYRGRRRAASLRARQG